MHGIFDLDLLRIRNNKFNLYTSTRRPSFQSTNLEKNLILIPSPKIPIDFSDPKD